MIARGAGKHRGCPGRRSGGGQSKAEAKEGNRGLVEAFRKMLREGFPYPGSINLFMPNFYRNDTSWIAREETYQNARSLELIRLNRLTNCAD